MGETTGYPNSFSATQPAKRGQRDTNVEYKYSIRSRYKPPQMLPVQKLQIRVPPSRVDPLEPKQIKRLLLRLREKLLGVVSPRSTSCARRRSQTVHMPTTVPRSLRTTAAHRNGNGVRGEESKRVRGQEVKGGGRR